MSRPALAPEDKPVRVVVYLLPQERRQLFSRAKQARLPAQRKRPSASALVRTVLQAAKVIG